MMITNQTYYNDETIDIKDEMMVITTKKITKIIHRLPRVGTRKTRRRRRPRTANRNGKVESCQEKPKGTVANSPQAEKPERLPETLLSRPYFDTSSLKYVFQTTYFDSILFKIRIFKIRTLKYLSS